MRQECRAVPLPPASPIFFLLLFFSVILVYSSVSASQYITLTFVVRELYVAARRSPVLLGRSSKRGCPSTRCEMGSSFGFAIPVVRQHSIIRDRCQCQRWLDLVTSPKVYRLGACTRKVVVIVGIFQLFLRAQPEEVLGGGENSQDMVEHQRGGAPGLKWGYEGPHNSLEIVRIHLLGPHILSTRPFCDAYIGSTAVRCGSSWAAGRRPRTGK